MTGWSGSRWEPSGDPVAVPDPYAAQPYPGQPQPGQAYQPYPTQPYAGQPYPAYPPAYYPPTYGPGYAPRPHPDDARRGLAMASAVLAFIDAGLLILAGALLLFGASVAASIAHSLDSSASSYTAEFAFDGVLDIVAGGLLIAGGVNLLGGRPIGRTMQSVGGVIVLVEGIYWPARFSASSVPSIIVWDVLFSTLAVLLLVFTWVPTVTRWLTGRSAGRPSL